MFSSITKAVVMFLFVSTSVIDFNPQKYEKRFGPNPDRGLMRVVKTFPYVHQAAINTGAPPDLLLGIMYTETNARPNLRGDDGRSYGIGQIWCTEDFNWIGKFNNPHIQNCWDYMDMEQNIYTMAGILKYSKNHYDLSWKQAVEVYHQGEYTGNDWGYRHKVRYFGELFVKHYHRWCRWVKGCDHRLSETEDPAVAKR